MKLKIYLLIFFIPSFVFSNDRSERLLEPPTCEITTPSNGASFDFGDSLLITVNASDPDGSIDSVSFYVDKELQYTDDSQPYEYTWNTVRNTIGDRLITVIAVDDEGLSGADSITIQVNLNTVRRYTYEVINEYPHDEDAFTQGLVWENDTLYEGTGRSGRSSLRKVALETGEVLQIHNLDDDYFGEGIAIYEDKIFQLTYRADIAFVYDKRTFATLDTFEYSTSESEGWGITHDGEKLIVSDGSSNLYFWDPVTYEEIGQVQVMEDNDPVARLNELEFFYNKVFANVYRTDYIVMIDLASGKVVGKLDCTDILGAPKPSVLNGIAYDKDNDRIFVTGKLWPKLFEIKLIILPITHANTIFEQKKIISKLRPNPFNNVAVIDYNIPNDDFVSINVYKLNGYLIRELHKEKQLTGTHSAMWDGRDDTGEKLPSGQYYFQIITGKYISTKKIILLK